MSMSETKIYRLGERGSPYRKTVADAVMSARYYGGIND